jgi:hypothetical protein
MTDNDFESLRRNIEDEKTRYRASADQFRNSKNRAETNTALDGLRFIDPHDQDIVAKAFQLVKDPKEETGLRLKALTKLTNALFGNEGAIKDLIALLADAAEPVQIRRAALQSLSAISFSSPALNAQMPAYRQALRQLVDSRDAEMVPVALEKLASYKDEGAQQLLLDGLKEPAKALIPEVKAIQLLGLDVRSEHFPVIRDILLASQNPTVKREAVIALSADPGSQDAIRSTLLDKNADNQVRMVSMSALNSFDAKGFQPTLKSMIADDNENHEIRTASLNTLSQHNDLEDVYRDKDFTKKVEDLGQDNNEPLRYLSKIYLNNLDKSTK